MRFTIFLLIIHKDLGVWELQKAVFKGMKKDKKCFDLLLLRINKNFILCKKASIYKTNFSL